MIQLLYTLRLIKQAWIIQCDRFTDKLTTSAAVLHMPKQLILSILLVSSDQPLLQVGLLDRLIKFLWHNFSAADVQCLQFEIFKTSRQHRHM